MEHHDCRAPGARANEAGVKYKELWRRGNSGSRLQVVTTAGLLVSPTPHPNTYYIDSLCFPKELRYIELLASGVVGPFPYVFRGHVSKR